MTLQPGGTCTVNVGFKPARTDYTSVARLQFASNSDNAVERVLLAGTSTGEALSTVGADVPSLLTLNISPSARFGSLVPGVARNYDTAMAAIGDQHRRRRDPVGRRRQRDQRRRDDQRHVRPPVAAADPGRQRGQPEPGLRADLGHRGRAECLATWSAPTFGAEAVSLNLRQAISATEHLRAGSYGKTLTFTLSTTTP